MACTVFYRGGGYTAADIPYDSNNSIKDMEDKLGEQSIFGLDNGKHYMTRSSNIDTLIDTALGTISSDETGHFTIDNYAELNINNTGVGNHQFIYGWLNQTKTYGWCMVCSFRSTFYGKRNDAASFSFERVDNMYDTIHKNTFTHIDYFVISGDSILNTIKTTAPAKAISFWYIQNATDNPVKGNVSACMIIKPSAASEGGTWTHTYVFGNGHLYYAATGSVIPSSLTWNMLV